MSLTEFQHSEPGECLREAFGGGRLEQLIAARQIQHLPGLMRGMQDRLLTSADLDKRLPASLSRQIGSDCSLGAGKLIWS